ncbi:MarR family winged helix-turn-helix transcriptional regulator [Mycolicibacterium sp. CBM1]
MPTFGQSFQPEVARLLSQRHAAEDLTSTSIVWHLIRIVRIMETALEFDVHRPHGWTWPGFRIMANLYVAGPMEPAQLAEILQVSRPSVTTTLTRLERDGYVVRSPHPTSKSRLLIDLTALGREAVENIAGPHHEEEVRLVAALSEEEREQLSALVQKLYSSLDPRR